MSRKCELTGVAVQYGNKVSHSQRKTRRSFKPNTKTIQYVSELTGQKYRLKVVSGTIRTVDKHGGFDAFILQASKEHMSDRAQKVQKEIIKKSKVVLKDHEERNSSRI